MKACKFRGCRREVLRGYCYEHRFYGKSRARLVTAESAPPDLLIRPERGSGPASGKNAYELGAEHSQPGVYGNPQIVTPWPAKRGHPHLRELDHDVYCLYDENDQLLYVGMTWNVKVRFQNHAAITGSPWWYLVRRWEVRIVAGRAAAEALERELIWSLGPIYNQPNPKELAEFGLSFRRDDPPCDEFMSWPGK